MRAVLEYKNSHINHKTDSNAECVTDFLFTFKRSDRTTVQTDRVSLRFLAFQEIPFAKMQQNGMVPFCVDGEGEEKMASVRNRGAAL